MNIKKLIKVVSHLYGTRRGMPLDEYVKSVMSCAQKNNCYLIPSQEEAFLAGLYQGSNNGFIEGYIQSITDIMGMDIISHIHNINIERPRDGSNHIVLSRYMEMKSLRWDEGECAWYDNTEDTYLDMDIGIIWYDGDVTKLMNKITFLSKFTKDF